LLLTEGQVSDYRGAATVLPALPDADTLIADRGYDSNWFASELGRSPSTIKRELERNSNADGRYRPETAEARYLARRAKGLVLDGLDDLASFVVERLHENWTPEQIAGWLKLGAEKLRAISHETIYAWIYGRSQRQARLWRLLPRKKGKRGFRPASAQTHSDRAYRKEIILAISMRCMGIR
jgi:IS30 family transposase